MDTVYTRATETQKPFLKDPGSASHHQLLSALLQFQLSFPLSLLFPYELLHNGFCHNKKQNPEKDTAQPDHNKQQRSLGGGQWENHKNHTFDRNDDCSVNRMEAVNINRISSARRSPAMIQVSSVVVTMALTLL